MIIKRLFVAVALVALALSLVPDLEDAFAE